MTPVFWRCYDPTQEINVQADENVPDLTAIANQVATCTLCKLGRGTARPVPGEGNPNATVMLIGEAPGFYEDQQGRPFVGPAGQLLDDLLQLAGLSRQEVFITNVIKHRPPGNRDPEADEIEACEAYLRAQIEALRPRVIVTLGRYSLAKFVPNVRSMRDIHGKAFPYGDSVVVTMYHPAAALHQQSLRNVLEEDFRNLPAVVERTRARVASGAAAGVFPDKPPEQMALW